MDMRRAMTQIKDENSRGIVTVSGPEYLCEHVAQEIYKWLHTRPLPVPRSSDTAPRTGIHVLYGEQPEGVMESVVRDVYGLPHVAHVEICDFSKRQALLH
ncbi:MAG: hypothetical protein OXR66_07265 [Candidatus Woesearchaeota archaeon]|nr:hypothetical protein [Candidatus Woesearchaeota archaeon]